jgi:hypothetical protein
VIETKFLDPDCLVEALTVMGFAKENIEVCDTPEKLIDYAGKARPEKANVIVRREHLYGPHNDIGFVTGEKSEAIICEFSRGNGYGDSWLNKLRQEYAVKVSEKHYAKLGKKVSRVNDGEEIHLYVNAG